MRMQGRGGGRRAALAAWAALALALGAAGCGPAPVDRQAVYPLPADAMRTASTGEPGGTLFAATRGDPKTFNHLLANEASTTDILSGLVDAALVDFDNAAQEIVPGLVKSWEVGPDGLVWTLRLREGVRWSDGHPFSADDVLFTTAVVYDTTVQTTWRSILQVDGQPFRWEKVDSFTVRLTLPAKFGPLLETLSSVYPVPRHKLEAAYRAGRYMEAWGIQTPPESLCCLGPFRIRRYRPGESLELARNGNYWKADAAGRRLPYLDRVFFRVLSDANTALVLFLEGKLDFLDPVPPEDVAKVQDAEAKGRHRLVDLGADIATNCLWFNLKPGADSTGTPYVAAHKRAWFEDPRFRRAVSHALDRESMVNSVLRRQGDVQYNPVSATNRRWHNPDIPRYPYDPARAAALLDEMGLKDRDGDGVREDARGRAVELVLVTNVANSIRVALANVARDMLKDVGIRVAVNPIEFNTLITTMKQTHRFEAILLGFTSGVPPEPSLSANVYRSSGVMHVWDPEQSAPRRPWEAEIDRLMDLAVSEPDYATRKAAFDRVQEIMGEQQPLVMLARERVQVGVRSDLGNVRPTILRPHVLWNPAELYKTKDGAAAPRPAGT